MKKLINLLLVFGCIISVHAQSVGIGTASPDSTAVLDIFSTNKGVLIPRVLDTANVTKPMEGLVIYNKNSRSPYYYNGKQWLSLGARLPGTASPSTDSITYKFTNSNFTNTEEHILAASHGVSMTTNVGAGGISGGAPQLSSFSFIKAFDVNSIAFNKAAIAGSTIATVEFKFYTGASAIPYLSYKFTNVVIEAYQVSGSAGGGPLTESVSIAFEIFGVKDWVKNVEFAWSQVTNKIVPY